jgi:hypothetical protein
LVGERSRRRTARTIHQLLLLHVAREPWSIPLEMHDENVESHASVVAFHGDPARFVLHREIVANRSRAVSYERSGLLQSSAGEKVVK